MFHPMIRFGRYILLTPILGAIGLLLLWVLGFSSFVVTVLIMSPPPLSVQSDGIVVLTGGADRVSTGLDLLQKGAGKELLISGVYHSADLKDLILKAQMNEGDFPCCITLGFKALDTAGNASETATWVHEHHIQSIRLVTATYHMPRALAEIYRTIPDIKIIPHPVQSSKFIPFSRSGILLMAEEYHKTLVVLAKAALVWLSPFVKGYLL